MALIFTAGVTAAVTAFSCASSELFLSHLASKDLKRPFELQEHILKAIPMSPALFSLHTSFVMTSSQVQKALRYS